MSGLRKRPSPFSGSQPAAAPPLVVTAQIGSHGPLPALEIAAADLRSKNLPRLMLLTHAHAVAHSFTKRQSACLLDAAAGDIDDAFGSCLYVDLLVAPPLRAGPSPRCWQCSVKWRLTRFGRVSGPHELTCCGRGAWSEERSPTGGARCPTLTARATCLRTTPTGSSTSAGCVTASVTAIRSTPWCSGWTRSSLRCRVRPSGGASARVGPTQQRSGSSVTRSWRA